MLVRRPLGAGRNCPKVLPGACGLGKGRQRLACPSGGFWRPALSCLPTQVHMSMAGKVGSPQRVGGESGTSSFTRWCRWYHTMSPSPGMREEHSLPPPTHLVLQESWLPGLGPPSWVTGRPERGPWGEGQGPRLGGCRKGAGALGKPAKHLSPLPGKV